MKKNKYFINMVTLWIFFVVVTKIISFCLASLIFKINSYGDI